MTVIEFFDRESAIENRRLPRPYGLAMTEVDGTLETNILENTR